MRAMRATRVACLAGAGLLSVLPGRAAWAQGVDQTMPRASVRERVPVPRTYVAARRSAAITIDGRLDDPAWARAPWTEAFTDIEGDVRPAPRHLTRAKMLWDAEHWYIAAELEEPHLWATLRERDAVIYHDNDFELFADPDGDTHRYFELEINAFGTVWDLFLTKPYRDGGEAINAWDIAGLRSAVWLDGTINDARDRDRAWTVELAIPWAAFSDSGRTRVPPREGEVWRVNFSRVQWDLDVEGHGYRKRINPSTGKARPEYNWVWSPQGAINMHMPELWGRVRFGVSGEEATRAAAGRPARSPDARPSGARPSGAGSRDAGASGTTAPAAVDSAQWLLRRVYYAQREYRRAHRAWAPTFEALGMTGLPDVLVLRATADGWEASLPSPDGRGRWHIRADGLVWRREEGGGRRE